MGSDIKTYGKYGDVRKQAEADMAPALHNSGLSDAQVAETRARLDSFESRVASRGAAREAQRNMFEGDLPKGAAFAPNTINSSGRVASFGGMPAGISFSGTGAQLGNNASGQFTQNPRPYQPEFDSPDRLSYPVHRILANRYWRMFHKMDPLIGTGIDILSELWVSKFQMAGEGIDGSIKASLESMIDETELFGILPHFAREYLVTGEACPHTIFDEKKGYWVHVSLHNPDQLEVIDAPFLHMDPVVEFVPDDRLRQIVNSSDPALQEVRRTIPAELMGRIQSGQNIPLDSLNVTFLARKLHSYDSRGTSIISRLWRILMYEDAVFNASVAVARRHAQPIKVVKMGNERTGWIPGPQAEAKMAQLLAQAELDVNAWIVTHYGVNFEAWGTTDRAMSISRELDAIERLKLIGLGINKGIVIGEVTYEAASKGLQTLLYRLKTFRNMIESKWLISKYFRGVAKINDWRKLSKSESRHNYRIKRSAQEIRDSDYITPTLEWESSLSPRVDEEMLKAIEALEGLGIKISKTTKAAAGGLNYEKEQKRIKEEGILDREIAQDRTEVTNNPDGTPAEQPTGVPAPTPPLPTPQPPSTPGEPTPGEPPAEESGVPTPTPPLPTPTPALPTPTPPMWDKERTSALVEFFQGNPDPVIDSDFWRPFAKIAKKEPSDEKAKWLEIDQFLVDEGFLDSEIDALHTELVRAGVIHDPVKLALDAIDGDGTNLTDGQFQDLLDQPVKKKSTLSENVSETDTFFTGASAPPRDALILKPNSSKTLSKWAALSAHMSHRPSPFGGAKFTSTSGRFDYHVDAMPWDSPTNKETRNEWQNRLESSKLPDVVKSRVKYLENSCVDQWESGWEIVWESLERRLKNKTPLTSEALSGLISGELDSHVRKLHVQGHYDAFADIYAEGKLYAYKPFKYDEVKRRRLKSKTASKIAITVDSVPERKILDAIAESALAKVKDTISEALKQKILQIMTSSGSYSESVVDLANKVILEYGRQLEADPTLSQYELKKRMRELYDTQIYNIQRVMRTEAINAYARATLLGYREQGIIKVKWNAHNDNVTCNVCAALNGHEFEVEYLLSLGAYPISAASHPNCRCWLSPIASFISFEEYEREFKKLNSDEFAPTQTVLNADQVKELVEVIRDIKTQVAHVSNVPVEYEGDVAEALAALETSPYVGFMPKEVEIVPDVAATPAFQAEVGEETARELVNQITHYTDSKGKAYVSGFAARDKSPSSLVMRTWAQSIWGQDQATRDKFTQLYNDTLNRAIDSGVQSDAVKKLVDTGLARNVQVGSIPGVTLSKAMKDMTLSGALDALNKAGVSNDDARNLLHWRDEYVVYDSKSGKVVEMDVEKDAFVNPVAAQDPEHMFVESVVAFHTAPKQVEFKDPELYDLLKKSYFGRGEEGGDNGTGA